MPLERLPLLPDVLDNIPHGIFVLDEDYSIVLWNKALAEWTGKAAAEVVGKSLYDFFPQLSERRYRSRMDLVLDGGPPCYFSPQLHPYFLDLPNPGGGKRTLQTVVSSITSDKSETVLLLVTITDMTLPVTQIKKISQLREQGLREIERRKASEERLRLHVQRTPLAVIEWNLDYEVTEWNPAAQRIFSINREEAIGRHAGDLILTPEQKIHAKRFWKDILDHRAGTQLVGENATGKGDIKVCEWYYTPLIDNDGEVFAVASLVHDITTRKKVEEALLESRKMEAIGILSGGISHDFNNLLSVISGHLTMIRRKCPHEQPKCLRWFDKAEHATQQASELVKKLITFSERGEQTRKEIDFISVLENAVTLTPLGSSITHEFHMAEDLDTIFGDEMHLVQVLYNLYLNAGDAMPEGGIITTTAVNESVVEGNHMNLAPGHYIKITIHDSGYGIPKKFIDRIFDPYFTTKGTMTQKGIGLGLSTSYSVIQGHQGYIGIQSPGGKGTTVTLYLPAYK